MLKALGPGPLQLIITQTETDPTAKGGLKQQKQKATSNSGQLQSRANPNADISFAVCGHRLNYHHDGFVRVNY